MGQELIILGIAFLLSGLLARLGARFGLPTIPLFVAAGILVGPNTPGPVLIDHPEDLELLAAFGLLLAVAARRLAMPDRVLAWQAAFLEGAAAVGMPRCDDTNHPEARGYGPHAMNKIDGERITGEKANGSTFETVRPAVTDTELMPTLIKQKVEVQGAAPERQGLFVQLLIASFPVLLIILLFMFFISINREHTM